VRIGSLILHTPVSRQSKRRGETQDLTLAEKLGVISAAPLNMLTQTLTSSYVVAQRRLADWAVVHCVSQLVSLVTRVVTFKKYYTQAATILPSVHIVRHSGRKLLARLVWSSWSSSTMSFTSLGGGRRTCNGVRRG